MVRPKLVAAGVTLRSQVNKRWPNRDKRTDGWIGNFEHQARASDHNPDRNGWVHAIDIDADLLGPNGGKEGRALAETLANQLRMYAASGQPGSERIKYIVYNKRIASGTYRKSFWEWRKGNWGHEHHIHVSFTAAAQNNGRRFPLPILLGGAWDGVTPAMEEVLKAQRNPLVRNAAVWRLANRLKDLGYYEGRVLPRGVQGYPRKAVARLQREISGASTGNYGPATHKAAFG